MRTKAARRRALGGLVLAILAMAAPVAGRASEWPVRPIRIIVNSPPGGQTDVVARVLQPALARQAGQAVVVENRANAVIGIDAVAKAPADGYTLGVFASAISVLPALVPSLPFDPLRDLAPIALVSTAPLVLVTAPGSAYRSVADLLADARARPGQVAFASGGYGTMGHLLAEQLQASARVSLIHVPYKGGAPALQDVMSSQVPVFFDVIGTSVPHIRGGKLRALAIAAPTRSPVLPEVPTLAEAGVPDIEGAAWYAMFAPAGTPPEVVARVNEWVGRALQSPEIRDKLASVSTFAVGGPPSALQDRLTAETQRWTRLARERRLRAE